MINLGRFVPVLLLGCKTFVFAANDDWHDLIKADFPSNKEICDLVSDGDASSVHMSKPSELMAYFFTDNAGNMDKWLENLHRNVTKEQTSVGGFDCTVLNSRSCVDNQDGDCLQYNPASFATIRHQATNVVGVMDQLLTLISINTTVNLASAGAMIQDFMSAENDRRKKELSMGAASTWFIAAIFGLMMFIPGGQGAAVGEVTATHIGAGLARAGLQAGMGRALPAASQATANIIKSAPVFWSNGLKAIWRTANNARTGKANGIMQGLLYLSGATLGVANNLLPDGTIDLQAITADVSKLYGDFFESFANNFVNVPPVLFGNKQWDGVTPWDFAKSVNNNLTNTTHQWHAMVNLFDDDYFWDLDGAIDMMTQAVSMAVGITNFGIMGQIFNTLGTFVASFSYYKDEATCKGKVGDSGAWVNNKCYALMQRPSNPSSSYAPDCTLARDDVFKKAMDKWQLSPEDIFPAVETCNNNLDAINAAPDQMTWEKMADASQCFWPLVYADSICIAYLGESKGLDTLGFNFGNHDCMFGSCPSNWPSMEWCTGGG